MLKSYRKSIPETLADAVPSIRSLRAWPPALRLEALGESKATLRVLDPMAGSGTVLAVARANGHRAFGVDLDPLAVLLAGVWTRTVDAERMRDKASEVLSRARKAFDLLPAGQAYPAGGDDETRGFVRYWFDEYARRQLAALSAAISRVHDRETQDVLWCAFSRLIITKQAGASLAMDLSHSRPHRQFTRAPIKPFNRFISAVETIVSNCPKTGSGAVGPAAVVKQGDARKLEIESGSIDLVLHLAALLERDRLHEVQQILACVDGVQRERDSPGFRGQSVGAETSSEEALDAEWVKSLIKQLKLRPALPSRHRAFLARYAWDMGHALAEASRVLRRGGRAVYVVGDSMSRGTFIRNSMIVAVVAQRHGLSLVSRQSRCLPANRRYLPPPKRMASSATMDARMRREVVVVFDKP